MKWKTKALAEITHVVTKGTTPTTMGRQFTDSGINFIKAEALNGDSSLESHSFAFIDAETHEALLRSKLEPDDVLVTIAGAQVGRCGFVKPEHTPANTNQAVGIIRVDKEKANPRFVYFFFKQPATFALCQSLGAAQAAQPNVTLTALRGFQIPYPSVSEQNRIADILAAYDELMENNRRRMWLLENAARFLYREWFVCLRFPGQEHSPITTDGLPQGWEKKRLDEVAKVNRASLPGSHDGVIEYVDISAVVPGQISETSVLEFRDAPSRARRIVKHGDIIWSCVRPNRRSHAVIWSPPENLIVSTGFAVITPTAVPTSFLYFATTTDAFVGYLENHAKGAAYPAVVAGDFERASVVVPSKQLLTSFNEIVEPMLSQLHNLRLQNDKLRAARDLLLPRLMSGELKSERELPTLIHAF